MRNFLGHDVAGNEGATPEQRDANEFEVGKQRWFLHDIVFILVGDFVHERHEKDEKKQNVLMFET